MEQWEIVLYALFKKKNSASPSNLNLQQFQIAIVLHQISSTQLNIHPPMARVLIVWSLISYEAGGVQNLQLVDVVFSTLLQRKTKFQMKREKEKKKKGRKATQAKSNGIARRANCNRFNGPKWWQGQPRLFHKLIFSSFLRSS